jgi:UDP-glucose 4-epimerase
MARKAFIERAVGKPSYVYRVGLDFTHLIFRLSRLMGLGRHHPWIRDDKTDIRFLPINQDIKRPGDSPMPLQLLDRLIEEASHSVILDTCGCRIAYKCRGYSHDIGCLHLGDDALLIPGSVCREVDVEEAKAHARRAVEAGLVPYVGKAHVDDFFYGIRDRGRMLTVCFCCECCCITRFIRDVPFKYVEPAYTRLEGISVEVTDACDGCGKCVKSCFIQAMQIVGEKASIGEYCRACGRCASVCPNDAITIRIDDPAYLERTYERIRAHVKYD